MNIENTLESYGLNEKEARIYLTCLGLRSSTVYKISKQAGLPRSTCYEILESLAQKGLVSSFQKNKVKYFTAEDPHTLVRVSEQKLEELNNALPQLLALYGTSGRKPTVRFYEGKIAVNSVLEEFVSEAKELLSISSTDEIVAFGEDFMKYVKKRVAKRIPAKVIMNDSDTARKLQASGSSQLREVRILAGPYEHHTLTFIWNNKVATFTMQKNISVLVVESEDVSQLYKSMFNFMWHTLGQTKSLL